MTEITGKRIDRTVFTINYLLLIRVGSVRGDWRWDSLDGNYMLYLI